MDANDFPQPGTTPLHSYCSLGKGASRRWYKPHAMGFFDDAFSSLKGIVGDGAAEHGDALHQAIQNIEANPDQLAQMVGKLSNHPEIGDQVKSWLANPQAQELLARFDGKSEP